MASRVTVMLVDDIDGGEASETISFAIDGTNYEIDLKDENAATLRDALKPFVGHARRVGRSSRNTRPASGFSGADRPHIQEFARREGHPVPSERGRIAVEVGQAWVAAGRPRY